MSPDKPGLCHIEVTAEHSPLACIQDFFTPTITVDGEASRRPWGTYTYNLPAGNHTVSVSYPWVFMRECGKSTVAISLLPGETKKVTYRTGLTRYLPGKMTVE